MDWDYKQIPSGHFDFIWASPPCTEYSVAKTVGERKIEEANQIVLKTLEIIDYFKPRVWFIEKPQTGLLKKQPFMKDFERPSN
jgi:site-specific DNA-cytosine methylase